MNNFVSDICILNVVVCTQFRELIILYICTSVIYVLYRYLTNMSTHIEESQIPGGRVPITWLTQYLDHKMLLVKEEIKGHTDQKVGCLEKNN